MLAIAMSAAACGKSDSSDGDAPVPMLDEPPAVDLTDVDRAVVKAVRRAEDEVRENPDSADAWGALGMVLFAHEFMEPAAACFSQVAAMRPDEARWPYFQAMSLVRLKPNEALPLLERAVGLLPPMSPVSKSGDWPTAPGIATAGKRGKPTIEDAAAMRLRLLELYVELDRPQDAEEPLRQLIANDPENGRAHLIAARIALRSGRLDECLRELESAGYKRPAQKPIHEMRAEVYHRQGRREDAAKERQLAAAAQSASWPVAFDAEIDALKTGLKFILSEADRLFIAGRTSESIGILLPALQDYPDSDWAWILLGRAQIRLRQLDEAEVSLRKALEITPDSADAMFRMGVIQSLRSKQEDAAAWFRKVIEQKPDHPVALYNLGLCARQLGEKDQAVDYLRRAIDCGGDYFDALCALGDLLVEKGEVDEGRRILERARELKPRNPWILDRLFRLSETNPPK